MTDLVNTPSGAAFDILRAGALTPIMPAEGARPELAPFPDWTAHYLAHTRPAQRAFVRPHGDLAGSWPVHVREADGGATRGVGAERIVSLDQRPTLCYGAGQRRRAVHAADDAGHLSRAAHQCELHAGRDERDDRDDGTKRNAQHDDGACRGHGADDRRERTGDGGRLDRVVRCGRERSAWRYPNGCRRGRPASGIRNASVAFILPATGTYHVRPFNATDTLVATSPTTVTAP